MKMVFAFAFAFADIFVFYTFGFDGLDKTIKLFSLFVVCIPFCEGGADDVDDDNE